MRVRHTALMGLIVVGVAGSGGPVWARQGEAPRRGQFRMEARRGPSDADKEKARIRIGMTKEQQQQIEAVFNESDKKTREVFTELGQKHQDLQHVYDSYEIDKARERILIREIARLRMKLLQIHAENEAKIRRILTKEQHEKLRALMKEAMEQARRGWGRRPPPPGGSPAGKSP